MLNKKLFFSILFLMITATIHLSAQQRAEFSTGTYILSGFDHVINFRADGTFVRYRQGQTSAKIEGSWSVNGANLMLRYNS